VGSPLEPALDLFLAHVRVEKGLSANSVEAYGRDLRRYLGFLSERGLSSWPEVRRADLQAHLAWLVSHGISARSQARALSAIRALHRLLAAERIAAEDPSDEIEAPRPARRLPELLSVDEVERLLAAPRPRTAAGARDKAMLELLYATGLRVSELCNARIEDFDARNHKIKVMGKGSKERVVHLDTRTTQAIWHYLTTREAADPDDPLFSNYKNNEFLTRRNLLTVLHRIGETAGVPNVHPHRFRHTFAINFLRNGGNIYALQEMLGHASLEMCKHYLMIAQADTEAAHRKASPVANWKL